MKRYIIGIAAVGLLVAGCGGEVAGAAEPAAPTTPTSIGTAVVQVDCGEDGVASIVTVYGGHREERLIGRNPTTKSIGGRDNFSNNYGLSHNAETAELTVTVKPTTGTCDTVITEYESGDTLWEKSTAGKAEVTMIVKGEDA